MPDVMLFGEGWKGEKRSSRVAEPDDYISYMSKIEYTQSQLELAAPEPLAFKHSFRVSIFHSNSGQDYLIAVSGEKPQVEWVEQAILAHQPSPLKR